MGNCYLIGGKEKAHGLPGNLSLRNLPGKIYDFYGDVEIKKNDQGEWSIVLKESNKSSYVEDISGEIIKSKDHMLYVMAGDMPICAVRIDNVIKNHQIIFEIPMYAEVNSFSGSDAMPLELLSVVQETHLPDTLFFKDCQYNAKEETLFRKWEAENEFGFRDKACDEKEEQIESSYAGIDAYADERGLKIVLDRERNDRFVDDCLVLVKEIYHVCEFGDNTMRSLDFYLTDRIRGRNCGHLSFNKKYDSITDTMQIVFDAFIGGGELEEYKDMFKKRLN